MLAFTGYIREHLLDAMPEVSYGMDVGLVLHVPSIVIIDYFV